MAEVLGDVDRLLTVVEHSAHSDAEDILGNAENEAERILSEAEERANSERKRILGPAREEARRITRQEGSQSRQETRREFLRAREELIDNVWERAGDRLNQMRESDGAYAEVLGNLTIHAASLLGAGKYELASDSAGHELLTEDRLDEWSHRASEELGVAVELSRAEKPAPELEEGGGRTPGGLIVSERDGRRTINAGFAARLDVARDEMREEVVSRLISHE